MVADEIWEYYYNDAARSIELLRTKIQELTAERDKLRNELTHLRIVMRFMENGEEIYTLE